jgi:hypothetical protein
MAYYATVASGLWTDAATWGLGGSVLTPPDDARIRVLHDVTVNAPIVLGDSPATGQAGTGTVQTAPAGGAGLVGTGTAFTSQLKVGDLLDFGDWGRRVVARIDSDTLLMMGTDLFMPNPQPFTFSPLVLYVGPNGRLTVHAPMKVRGPALWDFHAYSSPLVTTCKVEGVGAGLEIDASQAASPMATHYPIVLQIGGAWSRFHMAGTAENRVYLRSNPAGGNGYISRWGGYYGSWQRYEYCDISRLGTDTIPAGPIDMSQDMPEFVMDHCTVHTCGRWTQEGMAGGSSAGGVFKIDRTTFRLSLDASGDWNFGYCVRLPMGVPGGNYSIKGSVFDKGVMVPSDYYTIGGPSVGEGNVFSGSWPFQHQTSGGAPCTLFRHNLVHMQRSANTPFICPGTVEDSYLYIDLQGADFNHHPCSMSDRYRHDLKGVVWEWNKADPDGDFIQVPMPNSVLGTYNVVNCIKLPAADQSSGGSITAGGAGGTRIRFNHNTFHLGAFGGFIVGETFSGVPGMFESIEGNLFWDYAVRESYFRSGSSYFGGLVTDIVAPNKMGHNGRFNTYSGSHNTVAGVPNQTLPGIDWAKFSSAPGLGDVTADPQFLKAGAGLADWDLSLGGPGTRENALAELRKKNDVSGYNAAYNIPALLAFVRSKHRPTNAAYANASYSGDLQTTDAAGNALGGTLGAMAYLTGLALTPGSASFHSSRPGRIIVQSSEAIGGTAPYAKRWQRADGAGSYVNMTDGPGVIGATSLIVLDSTVAKGVPYHYRLVFTDAALANATGNVVNPTPLGDETPNVAAWEARLPGIFATMSNTLETRVGVGTDVDINLDLNHDGLSVALRALPRFPANTDILSYAAENRRLYRDGYLLPNNGGVRGYYAFSEGLLLDWEVNGNATSRDALDKLRNGEYMNNVISGLEDSSFSREVSYSILLQLALRRAGLAWTRSILDQRVGCCKQHIDFWTNPNIGQIMTDVGWFIQPFMMGITMTALAFYVDHLENYESETDATIVPYLIRQSDWLWDNAWERNFHTGTFPLHWTGDPEAPNAGGEGPPDYNSLLNMYNVYPNFWLWRRTGDDKWRDRGSVIFNHGIGTPDMNAPKKLNEYFRWSSMAMDLWQVAPPAPEPPSFGRLRILTLAGRLRIRVDTSGA